MANGQQLAQENKQRFDAWVAERYPSKFWPSYVRTNKLNSTEIARECGITVLSKSRLKARKSSWTCVQGVRY